MTQPIIKDEHGTERFKRNAIVEFLLETARKNGVDMNTLAVADFTDEDRRQFAQLIGYSTRGYLELSYADPFDVWGAPHGLDEREAHVNLITHQLARVQHELEEAMAMLPRADGVDWKSEARKLAFLRINAEGPVQEVYAVALADMDRDILRMFDLVGGLESALEMEKAL